MVIAPENNGGREREPTDPGGDRDRRVWRDQADYSPTTRTDRLTSRLVDRRGLATWPRQWFVNQFWFDARIGSGGSVR
jgi:hypothetical protein